MIRKTKKQKIYSLCLKCTSEIILSFQYWKINVFMIHCIFILGNVCVVQYDKETTIDVVNFRETFNERRGSGVGAIKSFDGNQ